MSGGVYFIDIVIFAMIAAFLIYRLRSVLGRRTGEERQRPNPFATRGQEGAGQQGREPAGGDNVIPLPERLRIEDRESALGEPAFGEPGSLAAGLAEIRSADPRFDAAAFEQGAQVAFGMIVEAFARGDTATLRPLVSDDLYDDFSDAIRSRMARGEIHETQVERVKQADLIEARLDGRTAFIAVKFVSDQINVTRDDQGAVIDGDPNTTTEIVDIWTFARNTKSASPNWLLVETRTPN